MHQSKKEMLSQQWSQRFSFDNHNKLDLEILHEHEIANQNLETGFTAKLFNKK